MIEKVKKLVQQKRALAVAPHYNGIHSSIVYTKQGALNLVETVDEVMDQICTSFGSDLKGRINGTRKQLNYRKKPPILISEYLPIVAIPFPSHIPREDLWVLTKDFKIEQNGKSKSKIIFDNQLSFDIPRKRESVENQRMRAIQVLYEFTFVGRDTGTGTLSPLLLNAK